MMLFASAIDGVRTCGELEMTANVTTDSYSDGYSTVQYGFPTLSNFYIASSRFVSSSIGRRRHGNERSHRGACRALLYFARR
jgi:hypothetical protein